MRKTRKYYAHVKLGEEGTIMVIGSTWQGFADKIGNNVKVGKCCSAIVGEATLFWTADMAINFKVAHGAAWTYFRTVRPDVDLPF